MTMLPFEGPARVQRSRRIERRVFDVPAACSTLPLLRSVVRDLTHRYARLAHLRLERNRLRRMGTGDRAARIAQFRVADEIDATKTELQSVLVELDNLGAVLLDPVHGEVGFPTIVNGSLAFLVYRSEDEDICHWRYRDQPKLRQIPTTWQSHRPAAAEQSEGLLV